MTTRQDFDQPVARLIREGLPTLDDAGFSQSVVRHVRRRLWGRRVTLFGAATAGLLLALPYAGDAVLAVSGQLVALAEQWESFGGSNDLAGVVGALPAREPLMQFSGRLAEFGANWNNPGWFMQFGIAVPAALAALLSPLAVRLFER